MVADAGMISDSNLKALAGAGLKCIIGQKIPEIPYVVEQCGSKHMSSLALAALSSTVGIPRARKFDKSQQLGLPLGIVLWFPRRSRMYTPAH